MSIVSNDAYVEPLRRVLHRLLDELHLPWSFWLDICIQPSVIQRSFGFPVLFTALEMGIKGDICGSFQRRFESF